MKRFVKGGVTKRRSREGVDEREKERERRSRSSCFRPGEQQCPQTNEHPASIVRFIGTAQPLSPLVTHPGSAYAPLSFPHSCFSLSLPLPRNRKPTSSSSSSSSSSWFSSSIVIIVVVVVVQQPGWGVLDQPDAGQHRLNISASSNLRQRGPPPWVSPHEEVGFPTVPLSFVPRARVLPWFSSIFTLIVFFVCAQWK